MRKHLILLLTLLLIIGNVANCFAEELTLACEEEWLCSNNRSCSPPVFYSAVYILDLDNKVVKNSKGDWSVPITKVTDSIIIFKQGESTGEINRISGKFTLGLADGKQYKKGYCKKTNAQF